VNRKFYQTFELLTEDQQAAFARWLAAELHGQQVLVQALLHLTIEEREESRIWQGLLGVNPKLPPKSDQVLGRLYGLLMGHLEEFLAIEAFRKDRLRKDGRILEALNVLQSHSPSIPTDFLKAANKVRRRLREQNQRDRLYFEALLKLELETAQHHILTQQSGARDRSLHRHECFLLGWLHNWAERKLQRLDEQLDQHHGPPLGFSTEVETGLLTEANRIVHEQKDQVLDLYVRLIELKQSQSEAIAPIMLDFRARQAQFSSTARYDLFISIYNELLRLKKSWEAEKITHLTAQWLLWGIKEGWAILNNQLPVTVFGNYFHLRTRMASLLETEELPSYFKETAQHLTDFQPLLAEPERVELTHFHRLQMWYIAEEDDQFLQQQTLVPVFSPRRQIEIRLFALHIRYRKNDLYLLTSSLHSWLEFVRLQKKVSAKLRKSFLLHGRYLRQLFRLQSDQERQQLASQIEQSDAPVPYQTWLLRLVLR
jgi:hypothetical protein